jgi:hypothetical protein
MAEYSWSVGQTLAEDIPPGSILQLPLGDADAARADPEDAQFSLDNVVLPLTEFAVAIDADAQIARVSNSSTKAWPKGAQAYLYLPRQGATGEGASEIAAMQAEIDMLQGEVTHLHEQLDALEERVAALESAGAR